MSQRKYLNVRAGHFIRIFLLFALIIPSYACASNYGKTKRSSEITQSFKNYEVLPGYTYYHNGWENNPYAIVGIRSDFSLVSTKNLWKQIDTDSTDSPSIQRLVDAIFEDFQFYPYGSYMVAPNGTEIGILYSSISNVAIKMMDENSVMIIFEPVYLWGGGRYDIR
jgi:hypothetical protein